MSGQIIELLENSKLRQKVITAIKEVWSLAGTHYDSDEEVEEDAKKYGTSPWEEAWWRAESSGEVGEIEKAFDKYVIQTMAKPDRLTLKELVEAFFDLAKPDERHYTEFEEFDSEDYNKLYMIFINNVKNRILSYRISDPFPICLVTEVLDAKDVEEEKPLWSKNGISVSLLRGADLIEARPAGKKLHYILAVIEGEISTSSCGILQTEMSRILPTAIRSADLLQTTGFGEYKVVEPTIPLLYEREIKNLPWGEEKLIENGKPLIRQYLDAYYSNFTGKKDSIERRMRNAVLLLIESDNQPNNSVGIALSITAIEALLSEKVEGIATMLAERVGALLEPDTSQRNNATEFVKNLYNTRSRTLHGELVEAESKARFNSRHLAAAVLDAMIYLKLSARSYFNMPDTPKQLLKFLYDARRTPGQPLGIKEYNVRQLWRNKTRRKMDSSV